MEVRNDGIKEFARKFYWNHVTKIRFLKIMNAVFHLEMLIPEEFVKNCKERLSENSFLKGPSGNLWLVKLLKRDNQMIFKDGWKEFTEAHKIEKGDILTFEYEGNSSFNVLIYDKSSRCEREVSHLAKNNKNIFDDKAYLPKKRNMVDIMENNDDSSHQTEEYPDEIPQQSPQQFPKTNGRTASKPLSIAWDERKRRKRNAKNIAECMRKSRPNKHESIASVTVAGADSRRKGRKGRSATRSNKVATTPVKQEAVQTSRGESKSESKGYVVEIITNKRGATEEEKARAWELANAVNSVKPFFLIEMRKTHVGQKYFMTVPSEFVAEHNLCKFSVADLRTEEGTTIWSNVSCAQHHKGSLALTGQEWRTFVEENSLVEGDVCVFELSNADDKLIFDVQIFHAVNEVTPFLLKKK